MPWLKRSNPLEQNRRIERNNAREKLSKNHAAAGRFRNNENPPRPTLARATPKPLAPLFCRFT
jgi:hypothetical protein